MLTTEMALMLAEEYKNRMLQAERMVFWLVQAAGGEVAIPRAILQKTPEGEVEIETSWEDNTVRVRGRPLTLAAESP